MPDDVRKKLEALLSARSVKKAPVPDATPKEDPKMVTFRQEFRKFCQDIVLPALNDAASLLKKHGHDCDVEAHEATETSTGETITLYARLRIFPSGWGRAFFQTQEPPYIWVMPDEANRRVRILIGTSLPGQQRPPSAHEATLQDINREAVEQEVLNVVQVILGG